MESLALRQAAFKLQEWFGTGAGDQKNGNTPDHAPATKKIPPPSRPQKLAKEKPEERQNPPLSFALKNLDPAHPYLSRRGFRKETIEAFGVGYCAKGLMKGRIAIPIHNAEGELVAYAGRWPGDPPDGEGKYKLPAGFHKALVVFNLHRVWELMQTQGLILVEGFFDCMRLWQAGIHNAVAIMGSSLSPEQEKLIVEAVGSRGRVTLMFDEDEAGWACREDVLSRLAPQVFVKVIGLGGEETQPDSLTNEELRALDVC